MLYRPASRMKAKKALFRVNASRKYCALQVAESVCYVAHTVLRRSRGQQVCSVPVCEAAVLRPGEWHVQQSDQPYSRPYQADDPRIAGQR